MTNVHSVTLKIEFYVFMNMKGQFVCILILYIICSIIKFSKSGKDIFLGVMVDALNQ